MNTTITKEASEMPHFLVHRLGRTVLRAIFLSIQTLNIHTLAPSFLNEPTACRKTGLGSSIVYRVNSIHTSISYSFGYCCSTSFLFSPGYLLLLYLLSLILKTFFSALFFKFSRDSAYSSSELNSLTCNFGLIFV